MEELNLGGLSLDEGPSILVEDQSFNRFKIVELLKINVFDPHENLVTIRKQEFTCSNGRITIYDQT